MRQIAPGSQIPSLITPQMRILLDVFDDDEGAETSSSHVIPSFFS